MKLSAFVSSPFDRVLAWIKSIFQAIASFFKMGRKQGGQQPLQITSIANSTRNKLLSFGIFIGVWQLLSLFFRTPLLPSAWDILRATTKMILSGSSLPHIGTSMVYLMTGYISSVVVGMVSGVVISQSSIVRNVFMPLLDGSRTISALALFPLFVLVLGAGVMAKSAVIAWTAFPVVVLSTCAAVLSVDRAIIEAGMLDGATRLQILFYISLPCSRYHIVTGLKIAAGTGWISLIAAEMLGSNRGLGYLVLSNSQTFHFPEMYAAILLIAFTGLFINFLLDTVLNRIEQEDLK